MAILQNGLFATLLTNFQINEGSIGYYAITVGLIALVIIASYLLGSISSAITVSRLIYREDIRNHGSGNAGMTNMLRTYGKGAAFLTWLGDMLKTVFSVLFAALIFGFSYNNWISLNGVCYLAGLAAVLGHVYPVYYGFKGGKGVLVTVIMMLVLCPPLFLLLMSTFVVIVAISGYVSLASCCVSSLMPVAFTLYSFFIGGEIPPLMVICTVILGGFIVWCHRSNIQRLKAGNEKKISIGKKKKD